MLKIKLHNPFVCAISIIAYVALVSVLISNANQWFGQASGILGAATFLMLFVLSAAIVGTLFAFQPLALYLLGKKKEALKFIGIEIAWLALATKLLIIGMVIW